MTLKDLDKVISLATRFRLLKKEKERLSDPAVKLLPALMLSNGQLTELLGISFNDTFRADLKVKVSEVYDREIEKVVHELSALGVRVF